MSLSHLVGRRVYFDTNIFIYLLEGHPGLQSTLIELMTLIKGRHIEVVTSHFTFAELLPKAARNRDEQNIHKAINFLSQAAFSLSPVTKQISIEAGCFCGQSKLKPADALHFVTAIKENCQVFLTNDVGIKAIDGIPIKIERLK